MVILQFCCLAFLFQLSSIPGLENVTVQSVAGASSTQVSDGSQQQQQTTQNSQQPSETKQVIIIITKVDNLNDAILTSYKHRGALSQETSVVITVEGASGIV